MSAVSLVLAERLRQKEDEGFTIDHDAQHVKGELVEAALSYLKPPSRRPKSLPCQVHYYGQVGPCSHRESGGVYCTRYDEHEDGHEWADHVIRHHRSGNGWHCDAITPPMPAVYPPPNNWPWDRRAWKPTPDDRKRELVKAAALILAEIDRIEASEA